MDELQQMLAYERNKFARQLAEKEAGIAEEIRDKIALELKAIREISAYVGADDQRRIVRRLDRIADILDDYIS